MTGYIQMDASDWKGLTDRKIVHEERKWR